MKATFLGVASLTFFSCSNSNEPLRKTPNVGNPLYLYVSGIETRTTKEDINHKTVSSGASIGVFASAPKFGIQNNGINKEYKVGNNGILTPYENGDLIAKENDEVTINAYTPYNTAWNSENGNHEFSVQTDQSTEAAYLASDLLYGTGKLDQVTHENNSIGINFKHKLARIELTVDNTQKNEDLSNATVTVNNTKVATTFNPSTGDLGEAKGEAEDIIAAKNLQSTDKVYAIVVPQTISKNEILFTISTPDKEFTAVLSDDVDFEPGKSYSFTINIKSQNVELTLGEIKVDPWEIEDKGSLNAYEKEEEILEIDLSKAELIIDNIACAKWDGFTKKYSWWIYNNSKTTNSYLLIDIKSLELDKNKYKSLVINISEYFKPTFENGNPYLVLNNGENNFKSSESSEFHITENGVYVIDLSQYGNQESYNKLTNLRIYGEGVTHSEVKDSDPCYATFDRIYFTTKEASKISLEPIIE